MVISLPHLAALGELEQFVKPVPQSWAREEDDPILPNFLMSCMLFFTVEMQTTLIVFDSLVKIFAFLPPRPQELLKLYRVSAHFRTLAKSSMLWSKLFHSTPGFQLTPNAAARGIATDEPPRGRWQGDVWDWEGNEPDATTKQSILIHYPTLYRSRLLLTRQIRSRKPNDRANIAVLRDHTDAVYCFRMVEPCPFQTPSPSPGLWLFTGSRDRSIGLWRLGAFDQRGGLGACQLGKKLDDAHSGSVLSVSFDVEMEDGRGRLVTGSSDHTAGVWEISWGADGMGNEISFERVGTLRGLGGAVLDVHLGKDRIITW